MSAMSDTVTLEIANGPVRSRDEDEWEHNAYEIVLVYQGRRHSFPWKQGLGITDDPTAAAVLESLFLDACGYDNARSFEDWAEEYGYNTDSRKAEALYHAVGAQTEKLARLFGYEESDRPRWMSEPAEELAAELGNS